MPLLNAWRLQAFRNLSIHVSAPMIFHSEAGASYNFWHNGFEDSDKVLCKVGRGSGVNTKPMPKTGNGIIVPCINKFHCTDGAHRITVKYSSSFYSWRQRHINIANFKVSFWRRNQTFIQTLLHSVKNWLMSNNVGKSINGVPMHNFLLKECAKCVSKLKIEDGCQLYAHIDGEKKICSSYSTWLQRFFLGLNQRHSR